MEAWEEHPSLEAYYEIQDTIFMLISLNIRYRTFLKMKTETPSLFSWKTKTFLNEAYRQNVYLWE